MRHAARAPPTPELGIGDFLDLLGFLDLGIWGVVYFGICCVYLTRDAIKLALPGFRHSVEWWGLPTRLEWALAPDRGAGVTKLGPWLRAWPSGVCVGLGCRN